MSMLALRKAITMKAGPILVGIALLGASVSTVSANPRPMSIVPTGGLVHQVQSLCDNWQRECARLYGWHSEGFNLCMGQPNAIRDCSHRSRGWDDFEGDVSFVDECRRWRRECARLYGRQTPNWYACMGQPNAIDACAGGR
jgi:hypothetical protein